MLVGYMRVSSAHDRQTVDLQRDALVAAGVESPGAVISDALRMHPGPANLRSGIVARPPRR